MENPTPDSDRVPRVLVVDDDEDTRSIVSGAVSMIGFDASVASDGLIALSQCEEELPDIVILDVMMPGMDGNEVCRKIREMPEGEMVAIMMLTARDATRDKIDSLHGGADDYLTKPFDYQELQARMRALWRVRRLNLRLIEKNQELERMQAQLIEKERQLAVGQLAGTAAHQLGQPLTAIILNVHLLKTLDPSDEKFRAALEAISSDAKKMSSLIEKLKTADAAKTSKYSEETRILDIEDHDK